MKGSNERVISKRIYFPDPPSVKKGLKAARGSIRRILICREMEAAVTTAIRQGGAGWVRVTQIVITLSTWRGRARRYWRQIGRHTAETNTRAIKIKIKDAARSSLPASGQLSPPEEQGEQSCAAISPRAAANSKFGLGIIANVLADVT